MHGKDVCFLHLELKLQDRVARKFVRSFREAIFDTNRDSVALVGFNKDCFEVVSREGEWTLSHLGRKRDIEFTNFGEAIGMGRLVFGDTTSISRVGKTCTACFTYGREGCVKHMFNKDV